MKLALVLFFIGTIAQAEITYECWEPKSPNKRGEHFTIEAEQVLFNGVPGQDISHSASNCTPRGRGGKVFFVMSGMYGSLYYRLPDDAFAGAQQITFPVSIHGMYGPKCEQAKLTCQKTQQ